jgi:hypothetical protein
MFTPSDSRVVVVVVVVVMTMDREEDQKLNMCYRPLWGASFIFTKL